MLRAQRTLNLVLYSLEFVLGFIQATECYQPFNEQILYWPGTQSSVHVSMAELIATKNFGTRTNFLFDLTP